MTKDMSRAATIPHVEYEIFKHVLDKIDISVLKQQMCPTGDKAALSRFEKGAASAARLIQNLIERRKHRLHPDHLDYEVKA